jgi:hypothetical protein
MAQSGYIVIERPPGRGVGEAEAGPLGAREGRDPEIDGRKLHPRSPMLVDQGFTFGASER